jgi:CBS domain-containing protein
MSTTGKLHSGSYLMPSLEHASVADAMHPGIISCEPDSPLSEVARIMATNHVHCVAVIGISHEGGECPVWGLISDLEVLKAGVSTGEEPTARALANQPLVSVDPRTPLRDAIGLMLTHCVSHIVAVHPQSEQPIGILSSLDVAGVLAWGEA